MTLSTLQCGTEHEILLSQEEKERLRAEIPEWQMGDRELSREFILHDFSEVMALTDHIARLAERQHHHPDLDVSYKKIGVTLSTHKVGGLSRNDFILAAKISGLAGKVESAGMPGASLNNTTILVTGASRRIGRECACALADEGANIVVHYRSSGAEAESLCIDLKERGVKAWPLQADFGDVENAALLIGRAKEVAGKLDAVINSAATFTSSTLREVDFQDFAGNLRVNAWTPLILAREFYRTERKGCIINILDSRVAGYDWPHIGYIVSKHALALLTGMMALEFAPDARVNAVAPGLILPPPGKNLDYLEQEAEGVPLKRHGDPRDIARAIIFLLQNRFITGQVLYVDGGSHLGGGKKWTD